MAKQERIIWDNLDVRYEDWEEEWKDLLECNEIDEGDSDLYQWVDETLNTYLDDERCNLDKEVNGVIVAFADLGLWNGRHCGGGIIGTNIKDILYSNECDYCKWYCDRWNVKFKGAHHDGRNYYTYRVVEDEDKAEQLINDFVYGGKDMKYVYRHSKSLRPYVAEIYGW